MTSKARFSGLPKVEWLENGRDVRLLEDFIFTDKNGKEWRVPKGTVCDGSSIPRIFWFFAGSPFVGLHRFASIPHDYYCVIKTEPSDEVHKMYQEACLCAGTSKLEAKTKFIAIKIGGPKW
jgi:hypothetical protein